MSRQRALTGLLLGVLAALVWFSSTLAPLRIYQVDECQNLYMARIVATGRASEFFTNASLFLLGPLCWIAGRAAPSPELFGAARLLFLGVFWLNLFLLALIASERLYSTRCLIALIAAATLAPLWDYGFEIRHDNLILTGVLLIWLAARARPMGILSYLLAGAVFVSLLFIAVKAVVYVLPLSLVILAFPPRAHGTSRWRLALAWGAGALLATILIRISYGTGGLWEVYLSVFHGVAKYSAGGTGAGGGFRPWWVLGRLLGQTPLLLGLTAAGCFAVGVDLWRRGRAALTWDGNLPEALLVVGALAALMVNPTPYPYNLLHVVPYAFVLAFRYGTELCEELWKSTSLRPLIGAILVFAHLVPFASATRRHLNWPNLRQEQVMALAEDLTDPLKDPVYDGIGMVLTRPSIHFQWYLHSLNIRSFVKGSGPRVREMLAARPAAVFIPSYRTDWLPEEDHAFIRQHYVHLADDFWVLGKVLPAGGGSFEIDHPGRYRVSALNGSDLTGTYPEGFESLMAPKEDGKLSGTLDGALLSGQVVTLTVGSHRIETASDCQPAVVWVGPHLDRLPRIGPGDHQRLFVNWY